MRINNTALDSLRAQLQEIERQHDEATVEVANLRARSDADDPNIAERIGNRNRQLVRLTSERTEAEETIREFEARDAAMLRAAGNPNGRETGSHRGERRPVRDTSPQGQSRDAGLRTIERFRNNDVLDARAADRLDMVVRKRDPLGVGARYLEAVGDPDYLSGFGKLLQHGPNAIMRMTTEEMAAHQAVIAADEARAMSVSTTTTGGYAIPFALDPSIILTSAGATNPVRRLARVETIVTDTWKGISSAGVTAGYAAEGTEVGDGTPTLAQPTTSTEKGQAFVPFSIEVGQDWVSLQGELAALLADARDVADATSMLTGNASNDLGGIFNIGGTGGLTTTQRIQTAGTAVYAIADLYSLKQAVPARFLPNATWTFSPNVIDTTRDFVPAGSTTRAPIFSADESLLLRRPFEEWSTMQSGITTTGHKLAILGDWRNFLIVDRIGGSLEIINHLFGASGRPTGTRGAYYYWRSGAGVINVNAFRYLEVK